LGELQITRGEKKNRGHTLNFGEKISEKGLGTFQGPEEGSLLQGKRRGEAPTVRMPLVGKSAKRSVNQRKGHSFVNQGSRVKFWGGEDTEVPLSVFGGAGNPGKPATFR